MTNKKNSGRTRVYSEESVDHLKKLWHILGRICSKKIVAALPVWLEFYGREGFTHLIKEELLSMSSSTIDRYLRSYKARFARTKRTGTRRSQKFKNIIPIKDFDQYADRPGYLQADTVAHCGGSISGKFMWTLTVTDEFSGWTTNCSMFGKGASESLEAVVGCLSPLPFDLVSFNTDNGTEFINSELYNYILRNYHGTLKFTRSRPYRKNDNAHVEQKNFTHVRELFGYDRIDNNELFWMMNSIYRKLFNPLYNFFIPQLKSIKKTRVGSKYIRKYDSPKTPYQRLMESDHVSNDQKEELKKTYESLCPFDKQAQL
jgi:hypothetical protein